MKTPVFLLLSILIAHCSIGQSHTANFNISDGLALEGYDPVSYFTSQEPQQGKKEISSQFEGVTYRFASEKNKATFEKTPLKYLPQYGGWCAYAMGASGEKVEVDPETFKIKDGKLYLFYNRFFNNTLTKWNADEAALEGQANKHWNRIINNPSKRK